MSEIHDEAIRQWMSDWADQYDQSLDDDKMAAFIGKTVEMQRPEIEDTAGGVREAKTFTLGVVGWTRDRLQDTDGAAVNRWSLLTNEGNAVAIYAGTTLEIVDGG